ncbi:transglutaminase-like domain-containing protein [Sporosarcina sp. YIM B06819]|uniref:transglutaminase-like domain-containing protein n=1 Tax=Sporosarcina sp. YIM B06819 TaxID=3081769 RepID=UPI00298C930A|nr:transglutaminase-like domain-containing protein [Sporosarcina sp. YIM B06819]
MVNTTQFIALDEHTRVLIEEKFQYKREFAKAKGKELFGVFDEVLTADEELALKYIFAYMPLNDLADYDGTLFLEHVRKTLNIQSVVSWGAHVPSSIFLHFVLPYRVNNENIEDIRELLFEEIYPRVKEMSMEEAILETNHWCHEKANYIGNDRRTVSPLTLIRTALGRCGEQSTLAVAALRSIGIPARQVYTPLWAHSDSNHAWVEAWADGKWHFLGACEPEPRLNQGWFQKPAKRAMLIHTRINAEYNGPEEVTLAEPWYSELNLTSFYADTKKLKVQITDCEGKPTNAKVEFQLFNFGALGTILTKETDELGTASVTLGLGDIYISAVGSTGWGFAKCSVKETDEITIALTTEIPSDTAVEFKMIPPPDMPDDVTIKVTTKEKELHAERVKQGAAIRANYEATFLQEKDAEEVARECMLPTARVWKVLKNARGNSQEIAAFLREYSTEYGEWSLRLLEVLNDKDMTDTFRPTLADHLQSAMKVKESIQQELDDEMFADYILCPRVEFEMITAFRTYFIEKLGANNIQSFLANPISLVETLDNEIEVIRDMTYYRGAATPEGSFKLKKADPLSRDILFVAVARSVGIPARLEPSDKRPQFFSDGAWQNAQFSDQITGGETLEQTGTVLWENDDAAEEASNYFKSLTIARFTKGVYQTLFYKFDDSNQQQMALPQGHYRITTSTRLPDGTALLCLRYFEVKAGEDITVPLTLPKHVADVPVIAQANLDCQVESMEGQNELATNFTGVNGTTFAWIEPDREPSKHLLREFREMKEEWESLDVSINCFVSEEKWDTVHSLSSTGDFPNNLTFFKDKATYDALLAISQNLQSSTEVEREFPVVYVLDEKQRIRHMTEGYKLGISKEVVDVYKQISQLQND